MGSTSERRKEAEAAWDKALKAYAQGLSLVPENRENLKTWWKTQIETAENAKNQNAAWVLFCTAQKATNLAIVAESKANAAPAAEQSPLWDEAIERRREAEAAWDEAFKALAQGLSLVPENRDDLKTWWKKSIENTNTRLMVSKAESMAIEADGKAWRGLATDAGPLFDEAIVRRKETIAAYDEELKLWKRKLAEANNEVFKAWYKSEITRAENAKNHHSAQLAGLFHVF